MEDKCCLDIKLEDEFAISQGMYFPLSIIKAQDILKNWYYVNYMLPIAKLDGPDSLLSVMADTYTYGSEASIHGKIMRYSNIDVEFCKQISDIVPILCKEISQRQYCVLFLDFYHLERAVQYQTVHFSHEILFYGYDSTKQIFKCMGFLNKPFEVFELSYDEVRCAFQEVLLYADNMNGWDSHMCMMFQVVRHKESYPYDGKLFLEKLKRYVYGMVSPKEYHEQLLYMNYSESTKIAFGIKISELLREYLLCVKEVLVQRSESEKISPKYSSLCMYRDSHIALLKRMHYYAEQMGRKEKTDLLLNKYKMEVAEECNLVLVLYIKLFAYIEQRKGDKAERLLNNIIGRLQKVAEAEFGIMSKILLEFD